MSNIHVKYLFVGGGLASSSAAQAVRSLDPDSTAMLVGQEINRPYHRPPLSKEYLRREKPRAELFTLAADWFTTHHVQLRTGRSVSHLDAVRTAVTLDNGEEISFDRLLLATGATPLHLEVPGASLPGVYYIRTLEDTGRLHQAVEKARREGRPHPGGRGRVMVLGGGLLGVEAAASLTQLGLAVDLAIAEPFPWAKFAGEATGRFLSFYLEKHGIRVHLAAPANRLEGDGRVQRVVLSNGETMECDFAVAAIGAAPNKELLRGTPIGAGRAILVDDHCRTSVPSIYAAGDCAAVFDPLFGKHRIIDHWDNAVVTGTLAGRNMAGADEAYAAVNCFFSDLFELSMSAWGEARLVDRRLLRGTPNVDNPEFAEIGIAGDGRVAQVVSVRAAGRAVPPELRELVARRWNVSGQEDRLRDPAVDLASLLS